MTDIAFFPEQASTAAYSVDLLLVFLVVVCGSVGLLVAGLLIFFSIKYRRRPGEVEAPPETRQSRLLEWFWTLTPLGFFACMFIWGAVIYMDAFDAPDDAGVIYGIGKQWMWKFQHPEGQREINTLHVPVGGSVKMLLTSEDVIHSFFVPAFRIHMDVLPQRYTSVGFQPIQAGQYHLFCSQYCGTGHSNMIGTVIAMPPDEYQSWLQSAAEGSLALEGRKLFLKHRCLSCHSADQQARAPVLEEIFGKTVPFRDGTVAVADENYLRQSIIHPAEKVVAGFESIMPTFEGLLSEAEIVALIEYIKSLRPGETPSRVESYPPPVRVKSLDLKTVPAGAKPVVDGKCCP